jgi:hypothetical protein
LHHQYLIVDQNALLEIKQKQQQQQNRNKKMIFNRFQISIFLLILQLYKCLNSYIYLPDKFINEEIPIGSHIIDLDIELSLYFEKLTSTGLTKTEKKSLHELKSQLRNQQYTFLEDIKQQTNDQTYFLLDLITGRITTKRYLDRESMCLNKHCLETCDAIIINNNNNNNNNNTTPNQRGNNCKMNLKILLIPSYNIISMNIIIQDINDNKPYFTSDILNQTIPENVPIGHKIPIDLAYDADTGVNSIQFYKLINLETDNDTFELIQNFNELQLGLVVRKKLDREVKSSYHYQLTAYDGGQPVPFKGDLEIFLIISDINDNNPKFNQDLYTFTLSEDTLVSTQIGKIEAFDLDDGLNGFIKYNIVNENLGNSEPDANKYFELNETTGVLTLKSQLDFEIEQFYSLTIEAKDCGVGSLPAYTQVEIFIVDSNDNSPEISVSFLNSFFKNTTTTTTTNVYITEMISQNKYLAHVSVFDKDSFDNGKIEWKVLVDDIELNSSRLIQINRLNSNSFTINTGVLPKNTTVAIYDREQLSSFRVSILAWDMGAKLTYYNFTVNLLDENDNVPKFDKSQYSFVIYENNPVNYLIGYLNATDLDLGENSRLTYKIKDSEYEKYFSVDPVNGMLTAIQSLDRENKPIYRFQVLALDNGKPVLTGSTFVRVDLIDINDNPPKILYNTSYLSKEQLPPGKNTIVIKLDEDLLVDSLVLKFYANDPDDGENGRVKFFIKKLVKHDVDEQYQQLPFRLLPNGELRLVSKLDREKNDKYELIINCQDQATAKSKSLISEMNLLIYINDVNDNCPQGIHLTNETMVRFVNKDQLFNSRLAVNTDLNKFYTLFETNFTDGDLGINSELRFDLLTYQEMFEFKESLIRVKVHQLIYKIQIRLKITNVSNSNSRATVNQLLKLGKYVLKLRVSDKGEPSCSIIENFILLVGDNQFKNKADILAEIKKPLENNKNLQIDNENDDDGVVVVVVGANSSKLIINNLNSKFNDNNKSQQKTKLTHNDYLLLIAIISIIIIVLIFFTLICTIFFYNRYNKNSIEKDKKNKNIATTTTTTGTMNKAINSEILYNNTDNNNNRSSLSFKSTDTDQSNSIDSITSSTLTKETKTSFLDQQQQLQPKTVTYSTTTTFQQRLNETPTLRKGIYSCNGTLKYSSVGGFVSDNTYKIPSLNYKSILKDSSKSTINKQYVDGNDCSDTLRKLNGYSNDSQNNSDSIDINDLDEESTSFLTARIQSYNNNNSSNQYEYKSSAV